MKLFGFLNIGSGGGTSITVVNNYTALLALPPVTDTFYWCENSQGISWLPGSLGGTYYPNGLYYCANSVGPVLQYIETPYQATQTEVDAGTVENKFVSPFTLKNAAQWDTKQDAPIVVNANITAVNDGNYTVVANATFTDPTPAAGKGFRVFVRNGTAIVGGISYAIAGTEIVRLFHSGSWANYVNSGTNTGDETQSSILSKLGMYLVEKSGGDQTTTSTTSVAVTNMSAVGLTAGKYFISGSIRVGSTTTAGMSIGIVIPSGATMAVEVVGRGSTGANSARETLTASNVLSAVNFSQVNGNTIITLSGTITIGATSGDVSFIFAKTTSGMATIFDEGTQIQMIKK